MTYNDRSRGTAPTTEYREDYTTPQTVNARIDYHDRVRWGPIIAGIVITIASQLILSSLGAAIGLSSGSIGWGCGYLGRAQPAHFFVYWWLGHGQHLRTYD